MAPMSVEDFRVAAQRRLPRFLFDYVDGGSGGEATLAANVEDLRHVALRQRVLAGAPTIDLSTELFGEHLALPIVLGPVGLAGMYARRGEAQAVRAADRIGIPFTLSTVGVCAIDEVSRSASEAFWMQLYMIRDRGFMRDLLEAARAAGCRTLVFTVDMPVAGTRYRDNRSGLAGAAGLRGSARRLTQALVHPGWAWDVGVRGRPHELGNVAPVLTGRTGMEDFFAWMRDNFDPTVTWRDLAEVREAWGGPLILKGILDADDARAAADHGVDGIVVSNHGGRQLDGAPSVIRALPEIAAAVGDRVTVLADGGIRSGADIVRMIASGARAVMLGRAWIWALAAGGQAGVERLSRLLAAEMKTTMILTGRDRIEALDAATLF